MVAWREEGLRGERERKKGTSQYHFCAVLWLVDTTFISYFLFLNNFN